MRGAVPQSGHPVRRGTAAVEAETYLLTAAEQICDVDHAEVHPNLDPLSQD